MKKNLLISAIVIAIVVATVAISFAAWDIFKATDNVTFNTGDNVALKVVKDDTYTLVDKLVPEDAIKQNDKYKYEVVMAKGIQLSITSTETVDTVDYVWNLTTVTVGTASDVIKDVESFKKYFTITMRPSDGSADVALDGKLDITKTYDLVVKFAINANAQEQKVDSADAEKKVWFNSETDTKVSYTDEEYNALSTEDKTKLSKVIIDVFGDGINSVFNVEAFKAKDIKLEITFEAVNKTESAA